VVVDAVKDPSVEQRPGSFPKKRPGGTHIEPLVLEVGNNAPTNTWITEMLNGSAAPKAVSESLLDVSFKEIGRVDFTNARLIQVDFAALDGASRDAIFTQLTLQPDGVRRSLGSGAVVPTGASTVAHPMLASNFRVTVGQLPCTRVATVAPITVKSAPGGLSVSNLVLTISLADQKLWQDWQDATQRERPENSDAVEKTGTIEYLGPDMQKPIAKISFKGLGLVRLANAKLQSGGDTIERFTAEMYVEDIKFAPVP
jgi:hypothetical protein